ncbi:MAG: hypothetical protein JRI36_08820 [Deltaproteobacteria bacterium]|nr:hypothetical protein [Deltaproteobacteria bacterium]
MKIELRFSPSQGDEVQFAMVVNKTDCGRLSMKKSEAVTFAQTLRAGCAYTDSTVIWTGDIDLPEDWVVWHKRTGKERRTHIDRRTGRERRKLQHTPDKPCTTL